MPALGGGQPSKQRTRKGLKGPCLHAGSRTTAPSRGLGPAAQPCQAASRISVPGILAWTSSLLAWAAWWMEMSIALSPPPAVLPPPLRWVSIFPIQATQWEVTGVLILSRYSVLWGPLFTAENPQGSSPAQQQTRTHAHAHTGTLFPPPHGDFSTPSQQGINNTNEDQSLSKTRVAKFQESCVQTRSVSYFPFVRDYHFRDVFAQ